MNALSWLIDTSQRDRRFRQLQSIDFELCERRPEVWRQRGCEGRELQDRHRVGRNMQAKMRKSYKISTSRSMTLSSQGSHQYQCKLFHDLSDGQFSWKRLQAVELFHHHPTSEDPCMQLFSPSLSLFPVPLLEEPSKSHARTDKSRAKLLVALQRSHQHIGTLRTKRSESIRSHRQRYSRSS